MIFTPHRGSNCVCVTHVIHACSERLQFCFVGHTAKQCRLGLFQDSDFAGDLEDSKSTSGGTLCAFASHTFVPISWMCKKQTSVFTQSGRMSHPRVQAVPEHCARHDMCCSSTRCSHDAALQVRTQGSSSRGHEPHVAGCRR